MSEASLFVSVLPCSQLMYAEVFRDEKLPSWIMARSRLSISGWSPQNSCAGQSEDGCS